MKTYTALVRTRSAQQVPLWMLFPLFFAVIDLCHWTLLRLPYFWDEGGYYIPAALDFFHTGNLVPQSTLTNAHPPLPSILLAAWWNIAGTAIINTRTFIVMVAAAGLLGAYRLARQLVGEGAAATTTVLTALYPIWFSQSTLAHADIFAAAFTLWALSLYIERFTRQEGPGRRNLVLAAFLFSLAALSKETAVVTPVALAALEAWQAVRSWRFRRSGDEHPAWAIALAVPVLPLLAWYAYHYHQTGFVFGNPEFLRYNATANLDLHRIALCLYHRLLHLTAHMNLFVPVACTVAILPITPSRPGIPRAALTVIGLVLIVNWLEFSVLGGALLTRYLLPMYPLVLLLCVAAWQQRLPRWQVQALSALSATAFLCGIWINPPYAFAPEDNLTYRDMIVLHQRAIGVLQRRFPDATVLTAWPAAAELTRPELGYTHQIFRVTPIPNFSLAEMQKAATDPGSFDTALLFSTKWEPPPGRVNLGRSHEPTNTRYFDFHHDLRPAEAAALLHGEVVWQQTQGGEWAAVLHFPRSVQASLTAP